MRANFADLNYSAAKRVTRSNQFLSEIDAVKQWSALEAEIGPFYPKGDGRRPATYRCVADAAHVSHSTMFWSV